MEIKNKTEEEFIERIQEIFRDLESEITNLITEEKLFVRDMVRVDVKKLIEILLRQGRKGELSRLEIAGFLIYYEGWNALKAWMNRYYLDLTFPDSEMLISVCCSMKDPNKWFNFIKHRLNYNFDNTLKELYSLRHASIEFVNLVNESESINDEEFSDMLYCHALHGGHFATDYYNFKKPRPIKEIRGGNRYLSKDNNKFGDQILNCNDDKDFQKLLLENPHEIENSLKKQVEAIIGRETEEKRVLTNEEKLEEKMEVNQEYLNCMETKEDQPDLGIASIESDDNIFYKRSLRNGRTIDQRTSYVRSSMLICEGENPLKSPIDEPSELKWVDAMKIAIVTKKIIVVLSLIEQKFFYEELLDALDFGIVVGQWSILFPLFQECSNGDLMRYAHITEGRVDKRFINSKILNLVLAKSNSTERYEFNKTNLEGDNKKLFDAVQDNDVVKVSTILISSFNLDFFELNREFKGYPKTVSISLFRKMVTKRFREAVFQDRPQDAVDFAHLMSTTVLVDIMKKEEVSKVMKGFLNQVLLFRQFEKKEEI